MGDAERIIEMPRTQSYHEPRGPYYTLGGINLVRDRAKPRQFLGTLEHFHAFAGRVGLVWATAIGRIGPVWV